MKSITGKHVHADVINIEDRLNIKGYASFSNDVTVNGNTHLKGILNVKDDVDFEKGLSVSNDLIVTGNIFASNQDFSLENRILTIENIKVTDADIVNSICFSNILSSSNNDFLVADGILKLGKLNVKDEATINELNVTSNITVLGNIVSISSDTQMYTTDNAHVRENLTIGGNLLMPQHNFNVQSNVVEIGNLNVSNIVIDKFEFLNKLVFDSFTVNSNVDIKNNLEVHNSLISKSNLIIENEIEFPNSKIEIIDDRIKAGSFISLDDSYFEKSLEVTSNVIVQQGDVNIVQGKLLGDIETSDVLTNSFVFLRNGESDDNFVVAYVHDDGLFVGGKLHVNVDIPKYAIDLNGDMRCTGPSLFEDNMSISQNVHVEGDIECKGNITVEKNILSLSDKRLKNDIVEVRDCLKRLSKLHAYTFHMKNDTEQNKLCGLIAQEVQKSVPEAVHENEKSKELSVAYGNLVGILVGAINELSDSVMQKYKDIDKRLDRLEELSK